MCRDDWDGAPGMELEVLEGSGAYIICKIDLPVQSVTVIIVIIIIIIFFPGLCCFFHFDF